MKQALNVLLLLLTGILATGCEQNSGNDFVSESESVLSARTNAFIDAWVANKQFNGNLLIAKGDSICFFRSTGLANREFGIENSDSTKFLIGSITKIFTAYGILLLEQQGELSLEDKLSDYFPDFPNSELISIKQLLTHRSGITDYHAFSDWLNAGKLDVTPQSTLATVLARPFIFEPGEGFGYSNTGYIILGLIIEQVSRQSFAQFVDSAITEPLALHSTGVMANDGIISDLASGYSTTPEKVSKAAFINYSQPFASGNMYSTVTDLWKFTRALMDSNLLPPRLTYEIFNVAPSYGYGWGIRNIHGVKAYGHYGAMNGFVGSLTYLPKDEYFICFLTNDDNTPKYSITEGLVGITQGKEVVIPKARKLVALTEQIKDMVIGDYLVRSGDTLTVYEDGGRVFMQETGQVSHELFQIDTLEFSLSLFEFTVAFSDPVNAHSDSLKFVGINDLTAHRITTPERLNH